MNNNIDNGPLLEGLLRRARSFMKGAKKKNLSINLIFVAILEYYYAVSNFKSMSNYAELPETKKIISIFKDIGISTESVYTLIEILCSTAEKDTDALELEKIFENAKKYAASMGEEELSIYPVLRSILATPTDEIEKIISNSINSSNGKDSDIVSGHPIFDSTGDDEIVDDAEKEESILEHIFDGDKLEDSFDIPMQADDVTYTPEQQKEFISNLTNKAKKIQQELTNVIFGQDNAINVLISGYFQAELKSMLDKNSKKPLATYLFAGPPGVGKTFLAEKSAELLGFPFKRFDMSEYSDAESIMELIGNNKSYKDAKEGALTEFVENNPKCILLFDEIEKANIAVIHLFLQVLDAGRLRDNNTGKVVDFSQTIIIFTTNAAREIYENSVSTNLSGISRNTILKALEKDVDPKSGKSVFPAAICSRFATGNVVMFNHMEAHVLRKIAEKEITRIIKSIEEEMGVKCTVDDDVYSCLLFSEGGNVDARTIKSRASSFINNELYELFRLVSSENTDTTIENIDNINLTLQIPNKEAERRLFEAEHKGSVFLFANEDSCNDLCGIISSKGYECVVCSSLEDAKKYVNRYNIEFILCDLQTGKKSECIDELNIEDVDSDGRTFFKYICEHTDIPLYIIENDSYKYSEEEKFSLIKEGAREILNIVEAKVLEENLTEILTKIHQQQSMMELAKSSKLVTFETLQKVSEDGKTAEIRLFDLALETAVAAEDKESILSNMSKPKTKLNDVYGADQLKDELQFFINYLKDPKSFSSKGLAVPKGILFYGPPGTGKTMLAKAVAGESDVTFISTEGNRFIKSFYGEGEASVRKLFAQARKYAPTIIFVDEIDAIAKERKGGDNDLPERILNEFLTQMDGFNTDPKKPVFVLAATNFDVKPGSSKSLDGALLRRFDRCVYVGLPNKETRIKYLNDKISEKAIFDISNNEIENIAIRSMGMSLAQLSSVFEFAMRIAIIKGLDKITDDVFEEAFETFTHGEEKHWDSSELTKTAFHEAGHAFLCWYNGEKPSYLTIVARGNMGGYMRHGDKENIGTFTKSMLLNKIECAMAGRAAELVFFGDEEGLSTGASGDLRQATQIAKSMICDYGMDDSFGLAVIDENELSDGVIAQKLRETTNKILMDALNKAKEILVENRIAVEEIVEALLEKSHLGEKEIDAIFSKYAKQKNN